MSYNAIIELRRYHLDQFLSCELLSQEIFDAAEDILMSEGAQSMKTFMQHGTTSVYEHVVSVTIVSLIIASSLDMFFSAFSKKRIDRRSLIRGGLLHDYFLYDWHIYSKKHEWHGFTHAGCALSNSNRDFKLNGIEQDIIKKHMFPLNILPPAYLESAIVCMADKWCAMCETFHIDISSILLYRLNMMYALRNGTMVYIMKSQIEANNVFLSTMMDRINSEVSAS